MKPVRSISAPGAIITDGGLFKLVCLYFDHAPALSGSSAYEAAGYPTVLRSIPGGWALYALWKPACRR